MQKEELISIIKGLDFFKNLKEYSAPFLKHRKMGQTFIFEDIINGIPINIIIGFDDRFPLSMPSFFINEYEKYELIPHVEKDGKVCYTHDDYVYLDADQPGSIITESYEQVKFTIEDGLTKRNQLDFIKEFEAYWRQLDKCEEIYGNIFYSTAPIKVKIGNQGNIKIVVSDVAECMNSVGRFIDTTKKGFTYRNSILIPFSPSNSFTPPKFNEPLSIEYFKSIIASLSSEEQKSIKQMLSEPKSEEYVFFSLQNIDYPNSLFGIKIVNTNSVVHPFYSASFNGKIIPICVSRLDKDYLYKRGGNGKPSSNKKGLIIGGGSIGSFIVEELVRNGFFNLTVIDNQVISTDNCYRHLTGFRYIGKNKAVAIKTKVELYYPHSNIVAIPTTIEEALNKRKIVFSDFDYIIVATGNVTINTYLNKIFTHKYIGIPVFYSWNDPYGIGGHCLITNIEKKGCYTCLYSNDEFYNMASFANANQDKPFLKSISGCASIYTPYGSIDSLQTCLLVVKKVIEVLNDKHDKNAVYSWKGSSDLLIQEGFHVSERFKMSDVELEERKHNFVNTSCTVCRMM